MLYINMKFNSIMVPWWGMLVAKGLRFLIKAQQLIYWIIQG